MSTSRKFVPFFLISLFCVVSGQKSDVLFKYYKNGQLNLVSNGNNVEQLASTGCSPSDKFAFVIHGWKENCDTQWVPELRQELTTHRGGCIICIDYGKLASGLYLSLLSKFDAIAKIMTDKLKYLSQEGMNPDKTYIFGQSFGAQLAVEIGKSYGANAIKEIDSCDMANVGFDYTLRSFNHKNAAQNVQCIHTSIELGTSIYACHQNWRMGNCGITQPAAVEPLTGSHNLCPYFYISAFNNSFFAVERPSQCISLNSASTWPEGFKMGYMETRKSMVSGELFALTSETAPYNVLPANCEAN